MTKKKKENEEKTKKNFMKICQLVSQEQLEGFN